MSNEWFLEILADIVFWFHLFWGLALISGGFVAIKTKRYLPIHGAIVGASIFSQLLFLGCPLTTLEQNLRSMATGEEVRFQGGFIVHYFVEWFGTAPSAIVFTVTTYMISVFAVALVISWMITRRKLTPATT